MEQIFFLNSTQAIDVLSGLVLKISIESDVIWGFQVNAKCNFFEHLCWKVNFLLIVAYKDQHVKNVTQESKFLGHAPL